MCFLKWTVENSGMKRVEDRTRFSFQDRFLGIRSVQGLEEGVSSHACCVRAAFWRNGLVAIWPLMFGLWICVAAAAAIRLLTLM